jgi:hypothetical protein
MLAGSDWVASVHRTLDDAGAPRKSDDGSITYGVTQRIAAIAALPREQWRTMDSARELEAVVVTDGKEAAIAAKTKDDDGEWYWAVDPEDGLWFVPTHWMPLPTPPAIRERKE